MVIASLFATHVRKNLEADLSDQFDRLVVLIDPEIPTPTLVAPLANPSFSTPYGGFYWQITNPETQEKSRSRSMWDEEFTVEDINLFNGRQHTINILDPEGTQAIALIQRLQFKLENGDFRTFEIIIAEDLVHFELANDAFRDDLFQSLIVLALVLSLAAWIQISLGLAPLNRIKSEIEKIRNGIAKRMNTDHPPEVMPLVDEVNELLQTQEKSISFARTRAGNLAHALKSHLTVLQSEADLLRQSEREQNAQRIEQLGNEMHDIIDHQLRLSRLRTRSSGDHFATPLKHSIDKITATINKTPQASTKTVNVQVPDDIFLNIDAPDLFELIGILLENAMQWAKSTVEISVESTRDNTTLTIRDDGPGLSQSQLKKIGQRGLRLDEKETGTGIGLSIANEIVTKNRGTIHFSSGPQEGLCVQITLPTSNANTLQ